MVNRSALKTYGTQQVMTSSPAKLVALLFDKAIVSLREAIRAIEEGKVNERWKANSRATEILTHLANTLNHDQGGEIAGNLEQVYRFALDRLFQVDMKNDAQPAREVIGLLEPLRDAWHELANRNGDPARQGVQGQALPAAQVPLPATASTQASALAAGYAAPGAGDKAKPTVSRPLAESLNLSA